MDGVKLVETKQVETESERQRRLSWEANRVAEAEVAAGRFVDSTKVKIWIHSIGRRRELLPSCGDG